MIHKLLGSLWSQTTTCSAPRLSPRCFGEPSSRDRLWRLLFDHNRVYWNCPYSFQELVTILLLDKSTPLTIGPSVYLTATPEEIAQHSRLPANFSPCETLHMKMYLEQCPEKQWYDLGSNPDHRCRTETVAGALMTLTTNSHIWWFGCKRTNIVKLSVLSLKILTSTLFI